MHNINETMFNEAKTLATLWQSDIEHNRVASEKRFHAIMKRMLQDPKNKIFLIELLDQSFRSQDKNRIADQLEYIFEKYDNRSFFTQLEQLLIWSFRNVGIYLPYISIPLFIQYLRGDVKNIVIKGEDEYLNTHLQDRKEENTRVNINIIGEAVLGEREAQERIDKYIEILKNPNIDYVSIKISTIFSQINPLAHEWSVEQISSKLHKIYEAAIENSFVNSLGKKESKFINLDMEEYRDINLTIDVFIKTLSKNEFKNLYAGIVLQTYIPETITYMKKLFAWAKKRVDDGGAPIKVRLVKGANQEMELTEASLRGWPCVTYSDKSKSDANYKLLMDFLLSKEIAPYIHTGIASHNLFDQALALVLAKKRGLQQYYSAEMLEGMSETAYQVLKTQGINVILYAPTATQKTFTNAIAYLVRRFDENTAEQNFLRHSFGLTIKSPAWNTLLQSYDDSIKELKNLPIQAYREQDRNLEVQDLEIDYENYVFKNESDTDFTLLQNQKWAAKIRDKWQNIAKDKPITLCAIINSKEIVSDLVVEIIDKSQYHENVTLATCSMAKGEHLKEALKTAKADLDNWSDLTLKERTKILMQVANEFRKNRADLIGVAAAEVGKVFSETDVEVSEAIDFLNFYPYSVKKLSSLEGIEVKEKGVALVVSPWNFPIAIATGGIAAALATGNRVILKPSSDAIYSAYLLCKCFWDGGVSKNTLQFAPTPAKLAAEHLVQNKDVDFVIFTGSEKSAYSMLQSRPDLHISAETGGKDATIVTALCDRDQAVKNVIASAFNNSGQKCSATSLLVLEKELYEDENFKRMLVDATESLHVGSVWNFENKIGSLVNKPSGNLKKALEYLDESEEWLIKPSFAQDNNPYMLKPSIRWGTKKGDFCHLNELFGPVLSVMCAKNLQDAIDIVNATGYGLTSGIESLDDREKEKFISKLKAGNLYINRVTTGAIVTRQPFGGMGKSAIGSGKKAGGFNYVSQFLEISHNAKIVKQSATHPYIKNLEQILKDELQYKELLQKCIKTLKSFAYYLQEEFNQDHDYTHIRGESNIIRYLHLQKITLVVDETDSMYEILCSIGAAKMSGAAVHVSLPENLSSLELLWLLGKKPLLLDGQDEMKNETKQEMIDAIKKAQRARFLNTKNLSSEIYSATFKDQVHIASEKFIAHPRVELMHYFIEQSISDNFHRYGNLGIHALKEER